VRQGEECDAKEKADADEEPGLMAVTWRADVTSGQWRREGFLAPGANVCVAAFSSQIGNGYSYGYNTTTIALVWTVNSTLIWKCNCVMQWN